MLEGMTVFNPIPVNTIAQPMFFGQPLGIQQYTSFKYPVFDKLTQTQLSFFWRPDEVSLQKDRISQFRISGFLVFMFSIAEKEKYT